MLSWITRFFINHSITAHNRTSHKKSTDDDYGGYSYRAAKTLLSYRVCFGCFVFYAVIEYHCRSPPGRLDLSIFKSNRKERRKVMKKIILRTQYPWYKGDEYIEVSDEIADFFASLARAERAYYEKVRNNKAFYSLDAEDGIESSILFVAESPDELYEKKLTNEELYKAISMLPELQAKRISAIYFQGLSMTKIAEIEGVSHEAVRKSVEKSLTNLEKILKKGLEKR